MAISPIENLVFSLIDLLKGSIVVAVPLIIFLLIGKWLGKKVAAKTKRSWTVNAMITTFIISWSVVLLMYFAPYIFALQELSIGEVPSFFSPAPASLLLSFVYGLVKVSLVSALLSILLLPLELIGLFVFESISKRFPKYSETARLAATAYVMAVFSSLVIIFIVPEAIAGFFYLLYFGF